MSRMTFRTLLFIAVSVTVPWSASACPIAGVYLAGLHLGLSGSGCGGYPGYGYGGYGYGGYGAPACGAPCGGVCAPAAAYMPPMMSMRPWMYQPAVTTTSYTIPSVQYQQQAVVEQIPVTNFQTVNRMVYVPQMVSEQVPQTTYQSRVSYRTVALPTTTLAAMAPPTHSAVPSYTAGIQPYATQQGMLSSSADMTAMTGDSYISGAYDGYGTAYSGDVPMTASPDFPIYGGDGYSYSPGAAGAPSISSPIPSPDPRISGQAGYGASGPPAGQAQQMSYNRVYPRRQPPRRSAMFSPVRPRSAMWQSRYTTR